MHWPFVLVYNILYCVHIYHIYICTRTSSTVYRIDHVVSHVYRLALLDFTNSKLSSSCAAFIEMLDRDSTLLRVDTQAALRIVRYSGEEDGRGNYKRGKGEEGRGERGGYLKETRMRERVCVCVCM